MTEPATPPPPATLIYLDVDDEITSAAARIRAAAADRVAVVLPYGSRLATSRINFRLLAREATEHGKQIEVVCADASARALAVAAGLTVHPSVAAFEGRAPADVGAVASGVAAGAAVVPDAPRGAPELEQEDGTETQVLALPRRSSPRVPIVGPPRPPVRTGLAIGVGVGLLVLVLVAGFLAVEVLPSATIVFHPRSAPIGPLELTIQARPDVTAPDPVALVIPAQQLAFDLQASDTFTATGQKQVESKATGDVTFSNFDTGRANKVDAGSIVTTSRGLQFVTLATVTLPSATIDFPFTIVPSTSTVGIEAVVSGPSGNVDNNTIVIVPKGENKNLLHVTNKDATTGGEDREATEVSQADVDTAMTAIEAALDAQLQSAIAAGTNVPAGVTVFPETRAVGDPTYTVDPATLVGTEAGQFELVATAQGTALGVDPSPIDAIAESHVRSGIERGWAFVPTSMQTDLGAPLVAGEVISFPVTVTAGQVRDVDEAALLASVRGLVMADARARFLEYGDVEISLWPAWVSTIPTGANQVTFTLGDAQPSAAPTP